MSSFEQRLVQVMRSRGLVNAPQMAKALGYKGSERIRLVLNGTSKPSFGMLVDIARVLGDVDLHWLITGVGEPKRAEAPHALQVPALDAARETYQRIQDAVTPEWMKPLLAQQQELQQRLAKLEAAQQGKDKPTKSKQKRAG